MPSSLVDQYRRWFEYEKDANDPLAGLAESVGYCRAVVAGWTGRAGARDCCDPAAPLRYAAA